MGKLTDDEVLRRLSVRGLKMLEPYTTSNARARFSCERGHEWVAGVSSVITGRCGCKECASIARRTPESVVRDRLRQDGRGIEMIGPYTSGEIKTEFVCINGHVWAAVPHSVLSGCGCPVCYGREKMTFEAVSARVSKKGFRIVGEYVNTNTNTEFECSKGHRWVALPTLVMLRSGCPHCAGVIKYTRDTLNAKIESRGLVLVGEYVNAHTLTAFRCKCGNEWQAKPTNILGGRGCPACAEFGFNPSKPAYFYVLKLEYVKGEYVGFGITENPNIRISKHRQNARKKGCALDLVSTTFFENGADAKALEKLVMETIPCVDSGIEGFRTEATSYDHLLDVLRVVSEATA